jgi:hypothetical protein
MNYNVGDLLKHPRTNQYALITEVISDRVTVFMMTSKNQLVFCTEDIQDYFISL